MAENKIDELNKSADEPDFVIVGTDIPNSIEVYEKHYRDTKPFALIRKKSKYAFITALLSALGLIFYFLKGHSVNYFPLLMVGSYTGTITGLPSENNDKITWYVEKLEDKHILFVLFRKDWEPVLLEEVPLENSDYGIKPLLLPSPFGTLMLVGEKVSESEYKGNIINIDSNQKGNWTLSPISTEYDPQQNHEEANKLREYLSLKAELVNLQKQSKFLSQKKEAQFHKISEFNEYLTNARLLKDKSKKALERVKAELVEAKKILAEKQAEAKKVSSQLKLSGRVTPSGKLVSLARESLERENRWLESLFKTAGVSLDPDFQREYERAKRVAELKEKISKAKDKIYNLRHQGYAH